MTADQLPAGAIPVLDHGYVRFIEHWGVGEIGLDEAGIIEAARQSTQGSFRGWERDERLLRFLYEHQHNGPFEFAGLVIEVQAPIFVFREWHRHRTQSYNEMSARYAPLPDLNYLPTAERCTRNSHINTQAASLASAPELEAHEAEEWLAELERLYAHIECLYQSGLKIGIPKELARLPVPVGRYSRMRASANLRNWMAFLTLRLSPHAQEEIRLYAQAVGSIIEQWFPRTWSLFSAKEQHDGL